ncbi:TonB-dependent receptor [Steroidobacter cummioxidans]|uniref:TonB-dependent receptor n=1 Tax=Steroidobacter cummioxidans TaxID=1803913 RepID=UPI000E316079|nr:TonB-dependent receptor [Steroidobacter cummioxidans]
MSKVGRHGTIRIAVQTVLGVAALSASAAALSQQSPAQEGALEEIVVTGFRESLSLALDQKRASVGALDAIVAEDIADFPDLNLAESIQRVPGVSITRDAGEGRNISVRGLGPQFTRVRINGMEAMSANGGTDAAGGTNRDRSFDFNTFASELFNSITIRKTAAAELEEGSLGATVDLRSGRPFDYDGFTLVTSAQASYNDIQEDVDPRGAFLISNTFADGRFGALFSVAYSKRRLLDEGSSTVRWQNGAGLAADSSAPGLNATQLSAAFRPRIPRYDIYQHDQDRLGLTGSLQWAPTDRTTISLDALHAKFEAERNEIFLEATGLSGNNTNTALAKVTDGVVDSSGTLVYGVFDDVDIRSEARHDELETKFTHLTLEGTHEFNDRLRLRGLAGYSKAEHDNPIQTTLLFDRDDVDGYSYDFRGNNRLPLITYGNANVGDPAAWRLSQIRLRPQSSENNFKTASFDVAWDVTDVVTLKAGPQYKKFEFESTSLARSNGTTANQEGVLTGLPASVVAPYATVARISSNLNVPRGTPTSWVIPDINAAAAQLGLYDRSRFRLGIEPALGNNFSIDEEDLGGYVQADFNTFLFDRPLRANVGVRYVETKQRSSGYTFTSGAPLLTTVERTYDNTLPSLNVAFDLRDDFVIRASAAKVMVRPNGGGGAAGGLGILTPGASVQISGANKTVNAGNPLLDPYMAKAYDLSFEWYFAKDSLLSLALFQKDIDSFVQIIRSSGNFSSNTLGLPDSVALAACGTAIPDAATCLADWQFSLPANTPGGDLKGFEINYQQPFSFLPGFWSNFGLILNYTGVESEIQYLAPTGLPAAKDDLTGLSKSAYNATLYWENKRFSARVSAAYRDEYLTTVPGRNGNDVEGTAETLTIDASSTWTVNDHLGITLEALNLTDQFQDQYVSSTGDRLSYYHHQGRQFLLGARYKF